MPISRRHFRKKKSWRVIDLFVSASYLHFHIEIDNKGQFKMKLFYKWDPSYYVLCINIPAVPVYLSISVDKIYQSLWFLLWFPWRGLLFRGGSKGGGGCTRRASPLKLENIWFFGVESWFFTRNTSNVFAPPSARRIFFKCAPPLTWNPGSAPATNKETTELKVLRGSVEVIVSQSLRSPSWLG